MQLTIGNFHLNIGKRKEAITETKEQTPLADEVITSLATENTTLKPAAGGRSSETPTSSLYEGIMAEADMISPEFELELLKVCDYLAKFNADVSYAVDNIVQLGNTPATISFDDSVDDDLAREMVTYLKDAEQYIYSGGMNSLRNDLLAQLAVSGAISAEYIPDKKLSKIQKVVIVPCVGIRFKYNRETVDYDAYQVRNNNVPIKGFALDAVKKLNPNTYRYYALRRFNDNPTAVPPFISALEMIEIEKDMLCNMRHIIKKIGLFGFLTAVVGTITRKQGETDEAYWDRQSAHLARIRPEIEKGYASGVSIGYKGSIDYDIEGNNTNIDGFHQIMELVAVMKMAGMKQDPLMLGRNMNVAETMARVIMTKLVSQVGNYQRLLSNFTGDVYTMMLVLGGYGGKFKRIYVEHEQPTVGDKLREEQTLKQRLENYKGLRDAGIIDQQGMAQALDYEKPFADKDVDYSVQRAEDKPYVDPRISTDPKPDPNQTEDPTGSGSTDYATAEARINLGFRAFQYDSCCHHESFSASRGEIDKLFNSYLADSKKNYDKAVKEIVELFADSLKERPATTLQEYNDRFLYVLYNNWGEEFTTAQDKTIRKWIGAAYKEYTKDDDSTVKELYLLLSAKALSYFENSDKYFMSRFVTDTDTKNRIYGFIAATYTQPMSQAVEESLVGMLVSESWKLDRIVSSTLVKMDNVTELIRLASNKTATFTLVSVKDSKRCKYCASIDGKVFSVSVAMDKLNRMVDGGPQTIETDSPFINELFKGKEGVIQLSDMTGEELQAAGFNGLLPHPNCRCKLVKT